MPVLTCWNCGESLTEVPLPISRHENCPQCFTELHCCRLCRFYDPGIPDQCEEDRADPPVNKEVGNFCEWFQPQMESFQSTRTQKKAASLNKLDSLFGEPNAETDTERSEEPGQTDVTSNSTPATKEDETRAKLDSLFSKDN